MSELPWTLPLGATPQPDGSTEFRVWAPNASSIELQLGRGRRAEPHQLREAGHGVYELRVEAPPGTDYGYRIGSRVLPDPCSLWQPYGLRGLSRVYQPRRPAPFRPRPLSEQVLYELHIGTFTPEGTFTAAIPYLPGLAELGVTTIELLPVAEFPGAHGWGYDGVYLSAAQSSYGGPEGLQELIDAAHAAGLGVVLDVVYNHVGASGTRALKAFGPYFTDRYETPWGSAINYDDAGCDPVREWVCQSAERWIRDFGFDGLRLDAIHAIFDQSPEHIVAEVARRAHAVDRHAVVIAESGLNDPKVIRPPSNGGYGCDASWADDFHHALRTLLTDDRDGYYGEYGQLELLAQAFKRPYVYAGRYSPFRDKVVGAPADDVEPERFVVFCQNHDQVGNRAFGDRLPDEARRLAAFCTLLSPFTPMLFMGEEYGEQAPFQFFSDHIDERIAEATRQGRRKEFSAFASFGHEIPDPQDPATFAASKLTRQGDPELAELYRQLLQIRPQLPREAAVASLEPETDATLSVLRGDYQLLCNFGSQPVQLTPIGDRMMLTTHPDSTELKQGKLRLPPLAGALISR